MAQFSQMPATTVSFDNVQDVYTVGRTIYVTYRLNQGYTPRYMDWVGLYKSGSSNPVEYETFAWAPKLPTKGRSFNKRRVVFPARDIKISPDTGARYQFLYFSKYDEILGSSREFTFRKGATSVLEPACDTVQPALESGISSDKIQTETEEKTKSSTYNELAVVVWHPTRSITVDHHTLMKTFNWRDQLTLDTRLTFDNNLMQYLCNRERGLLPIAFSSALVPVHPNPVVPLVAPKKLGMDVIEKLQELLLGKTVEVIMPSWQAPTVLNIPLTTKAPQIYEVPAPPSSESLAASDALGKSKKDRPLPYNRCTSCRKSKKTLRIVKKECARVEKQLLKVKSELDLAEESIFYKDHIQEDMSRTIQALTRDYSQLAVNNDELHEKAKVIERRYDACRCNLEVLKFESNCREQELQEEIILAQGQNDMLEQEVKMTTAELDIVMNRGDFLDEEMQILKQQFEQQSRLLDDIMYTLSLKGYTTIMDANGNQIDLTKKRGSVLELSGWTLVANKREANQLVQIAEQDKLIDTLKDYCKELDDKVTEQDDHIAENRACMKKQQETINELQRTVGQLTFELENSREKEFRLAQLFSAESLRWGKIFQCYVTRDIENSEQLEKLRDALQEYEEREITAKCGCPVAVQTSLPKISSQGTNTGLLPLQQSDRERLVCDFASTTDVAYPSKKGLQWHEVMDVQAVKQKKTVSESPLLPKKKNNTTVPKDATSFEKECVSFDDKLNYWEKKLDQSHLDTVFDKVKAAWNEKEVAAKKTLKCNEAKPGVTYTPVLPFGRPHSLTSKPLTSVLKNVTGRPFGLKCSSLDSCSIARCETQAAKSITALEAFKELPFAMTSEAKLSNGESKMEMFREMPFQSATSSHGILYGVGEKTSDQMFAEMPFYKCPDCMLCNNMKHRASKDQLFKELPFWKKSADLLSAESKESVNEDWLQRVPFVIRDSAMWICDSLDKINLEVKESSNIGNTASRDQLFKELPFWKKSSGILSASSQESVNEDWLQRVPFVIRDSALWICDSLDRINEQVKEEVLRELPFWNRESDIQLSSGKDKTNGKSTEQLFQELPFASRNSDILFSNSMEKVNEKIPSMSKILPFPFMKSNGKLPPNWQIPMALPEYSIPEPEQTSEKIEQEASSTKSKASKKKQQNAIYFGKVSKKSQASKSCKSSKGRKLEKSPWASFQK